MGSKKLIAKLTNKLGRAPTADEVAKAQAKKEKKRAAKRGADTTPPLSKTVVVDACSKPVAPPQQPPAPPQQQSKKRPKKHIPTTERDDLATLYCLQGTACCALGGCVVCAHRLCQHGAPQRPLPAAQRPESCLRVVGNCPGDDLRALYGGLRVLTVGDGDLSFSVALCERGRCASLTATTLEPDLETLQREYQGLDIRSHAARVADVRYGVDARVLALSEKYDRIVFNFPCMPVARGRDGNSEGSGVADAAALEENKALVRAFVDAATPRLAPGGELHVTHKTKAPFSWWGLPGLVAHAALAYRGALVFDRAAYYPYANRKARDRKSFAALDAVVYVYARAGDGAPATLPPLIASGAPTPFFEGALAPPGDVVAPRRVCRAVRLDAELLARVREAAATEVSSRKKRRR